MAPPSAHRLVAIAALAACASRPATPSPADVRPPDPAAAEIAAARHLLEPYADLRAEIHPAFADSISAPGRPSPTLRDAARTAAIASALGAAVAEGPRVADKSAKVLLSEPRFRGDTATVTGTVLWHRDATPRSGRGYHTAALMLVRQLDGRWRVVRAVDLGRT